MKYFKIKNFEKYQHYHTRSITSWVKLYYNILDDYGFNSLDYAEKWTYVGLLLLAGKTDNKIPADIKYIAERIGNNQKLLEKCVKILINMKFIDIEIDGTIDNKNNKISIDSIDSIDKSKTDKIREDKIREDKIYCHPADDHIVPFLDFCKQIIQFLNKKTSRRYSSNSEAIQGILRARYNEKRTVFDCKVVIAYKTQEWLNDDKMNKYLRPSTLFRAMNFEQYLVSAKQFYGEEKLVDIEKSLEENKTDDTNTENKG